MCPEMGQRAVEQIALDLLGMSGASRAVGNTHRGPVCRHVHRFHISEGASQAVPQRFGFDVDICDAVFFVCQIFSPGVVDEAGATH